jgi:TrmH family RNA methyltransferase
MIESVRDATRPSRPLITSPANPRLRAIAALRDRHERAARRLALVDGAREVRRAIEAGAAVVEVYLSTEHRTDAEGRATLDLVAAAGIPVVECGERAFRRIAYGDRPDGILAVVETPSTVLAEVRLSAEPLLAVVEGVEKPGNLGAIVRSADAAGLDAVIVAGPAADPFHPNAIRASVATVFALPIAVAPSEVVLAWLREREIRIVAADAGAGAPYTDADLRGAVAIVLGSEAGGLGPVWRGPGIEAVHIPMAGLGDSLNVAAAAAILFFEARRQRGPVPRRGRAGPPG